MSAKRNVPNKDGKKEAARSHQPGQSTFAGILPEEVNWKPFPAFPPSARLAIVVGQPLHEGPYTIRVKVPGGVKLMPHTHPEDRIYTVISGIFYIGLGDKFDDEKLQALSARRRNHSSRQHVSLPLGEVGRIRHTGDGEWSPWPRIHRFE
jgi:hypothetical protein